MIRLAALALACAALAACGRYGPPVRPGATPPHKSVPPVSAAPSPSNTEQCDDPNAPKPGQKP